MKSLIAQFQDYVGEMAGVQADVQAVKRGALPHYLAQLYALYRLRVGGRRFLGIVLREPESFQPARFEKHLARLKEPRNGTEGYCLIAAALPSYVRQRLVERRVPFVVPGRQISWPALGAVVESGARRGGLPEAGDRVMPATQVVLLYALNGHLAGQVTPKALTERLGYTAMTMSRALNEIEAHGLGRVNREGKERRLDFPEGRAALWKRVEHLLRDPVRETVRVWKRDLPERGWWWAGETALASYDKLLAEPSEPVLALGRDAWKQLADKLKEIPVPELDTCQVQVWRYDPGLLARKDRVDPFSLYLSLRDEPDERVQMALEEMMEKAAWPE